MKGFLLNTNSEIVIKPQRDANGFITTGLVVGEIDHQVAALVLRLQKGECKEDLLLGCGLTKFNRGKYQTHELEEIIRKQFIRAGIDYSKYKEYLQITPNKIRD